LKFIHTADFHLDFIPKGIIGPKFDEHRRQDFIRNLDTITNTALEENVDLFIIAGDVFHSPRPRNTTLVEFSRRIGKLINNGIPILIVGGNHDIPKTLQSKNPLNAFNEFGIKNFVYRDKTSSLLLKTRGGETVGVVFAPYLDPSKIRAVEKASIEDYPKIIIRKIKRSFNEISQADIKILIAHLFIRGAKASSAWKIYLRDVLIDINSIDLGFDYIALGHVHKPQKIKENAFYPGSIERLTFAEENEDKFFIIGEIENGRVKVEWRKLDCRPMKTIGIIDIRGSSSPYSDIINEIDSVKIEEGSILRIQVIADKNSWNSFRNRFAEFEKHLFEDLKVLGYKLEKKIELKKGKYQYEAKGKGLKELFEDYIEKTFVMSSEAAKKIAKELGIKMIEKALEEGLV